MHKVPVGRLSAPAVPLLAAVVPFLTDAPYIHQVMALAAVYALAAVGLALLVGYVGELSLATPAFFGVGAYSVAILTTRYDWSALPILAAAVSLSTILALLIGFVALRVSGLHFALVTFAMLSVIHVIAQNAVGLTEGAFGIAGIPRLEVGGYVFASNRAMIVLASLVTSVVLLTLTNLLSSPYGDAAQALRTNPSRAEASGVDPSRVKVSFVVIHSAVITLGGYLYAYTIRLVSPDIFGFHLVVLTLIMVFLGGRVLVGAFVASYALIGVPETLRVAGEYRQLVYAGLLLLTVLLLGSGALSPFRSQLEKARPSRHREENTGRTHVPAGEGGSDSSTEIVTSSDRPTSGELRK